MSNGTVGLGGKVASAGLHQHGCASSATPPRPTSGTGTDAAGTGRWYAGIGSMMNTTVVDMAHNLSRDARPKCLCAGQVAFAATCSRTGQALRRFVRAARVRARRPHQGTAIVAQRDRNEKGTAARPLRRTARSHQPDLSASGTNRHAPWRPLATRCERPHPSRGPRACRTGKLPRTDHG